MNCFLIFSEVAHLSQLFGSSVMLWFFALHIQVIRRSRFCWWV